jgi:hypothetical protein
VNPLRRLLTPFIGSRRRHDAEAALAAWPAKRDELQREFFRRGASAGTPRGLRWLRAEWTGQARFAIARDSSLPLALAGVILHFEAIEGGELEDAPNASMPRDATALFRYAGNAWRTDGRVLFNLTPDEAIARLADEILPLDGIPVSSAT